MATRKLFLHCLLLPNSPAILELSAATTGWWIHQVILHRHTPATYGRKDFRKLRRLDEAGLVDVDWNDRRTAIVRFRDTVDPERSDYKHRFWYEPMWKEGALTEARRRIPPETRQAVIRRDGACAICQSVDRLSLDHIVPYSAGGEDTPDNLRVLCRSCNSRRGAGRFTDAELRDFI